MGLSVSEVVSLAKGSHKLRVTLQDLVKELAVVDMVSTLRGMTISRCWRSVHQKLCSFYIFEIHILVPSAFYFRSVRLGILEQRRLTDIKSSVFVEEVLSSPRLPVLATI